MKLSERLLNALEADKDFNGDDYEDHRDFYPNIMNVYDLIKRMEDSPTMINYDRWDLPRPYGLSNLNNE